MKPTDESPLPAPIRLRRPPPLDPEFLPAELWMRAYEARVRACGASRPVAIALEREGGECDVLRFEALPDRPEFAAVNRRLIERLVKYRLWQCGGTRITMAGASEQVPELARAYAPGGQRAFDYNIFSDGIYREPLVFRSVPLEEIPSPRATVRALGRHLDGCRVGFDLGGSDRKCAAVVDGEVIFSEEIVWSPYFEKDPEYHRAGVHDTIARAAAKLPRVDAIGGSAAGVYIRNEPRVASLFRGISRSDFDRRIRRMFLEERAAWNNVPFEVANDGEVAALAGAMSLNVTPIFGLSFGTSTATGYVNEKGNITTWVDEMAFAPVDFRPDAPADEWSGDLGVGSQYFSQQAVGRLLKPAGIELPADLGLPEKLKEVQRLMAAEDPRARRIYETIGGYLGYSMAWFARFYAVDNVLLLGRVMSGDGGTVILDTARETLRAEFPEIADRCTFHTPDERLKRHGQAIAAASLPEIPKR